jgi:hypothetical protein
MSGDTFHRFGDDYLTAEELEKSAPDIVKRVVLALGPEPLEDARHLLAAVPPHSAFATQDVSAPAPDESASFVIEVSGVNPISLLTALEVLNTDARAALNFPRLWGRTPGRSIAEAPWFPLPYSALDALPDADLPLGAAAFSWTLSHFVLQGREAIRELDRYRNEIEKRFAPLGWSVVLRETPEAAAARAARLNRVKARFARPVEMRLIPHGRPFPSRQVWRFAYALGLTWGDMDLFHWHDPLSGARLFTLSSLGQPGYFLPERAAEGEGIPGLSLGFELPTAPAPLETFDRMAVALDYLRHQLGGRPTASDGAELDGERLDGDRDYLQEAVAQLSASGITPGSPEAARYF